MSSSDIRARTALLVLVGLRGVDSVIGAPPVGPYMYRFSSTTSRAPAALAASTTACCSGGNSSAQRW